MKYWVTYDDLLDHSIIIDEFTDLDEAREFFKAECYTPAMVYDDFLCLEAMSDDDEWLDTIDTYIFTRLDRPNE